jgi:hypothetical protein
LSRKAILSIAAARAALTHAGAELTQDAGSTTQSTIHCANLYAELWTSLASLLRSYTAVHGLHSGARASVHSTNEKITARNGKKWLILTRNHAIVTWTRENGSMGEVELTNSGNLRASKYEEALDLAAERWARELMLDPAGTGH